MTETHVEGRIDPQEDQAGGAVAVVSEEARHQANDLAHHAGREVGTVADSAKQQARSVVDGARQRLATEADSAAERAAQALAGTASDLSAMAAGQGAPDSPAADVVRQIGERVDGVATRLRTRGSQGVMDDVTRWARAHPGAFLAGAVGAGFVVGRIFRTADTQAVVDAARTGSSTDPTSTIESPSRAGFGAPGTDPLAVPVGQPTGAGAFGEVREPAASYAPPLDSPSAVEPSIDLTANDRPAAPGSAGV